MVGVYLKTEFRTRQATEGKVFFVVGLMLDWPEADAPVLERHSNTANIDHQLFFFVGYWKVSANTFRISSEAKRRLSLI